MSGGVRRCEEVGEVWEVCEGVRGRFGRSLEVWGGVEVWIGVWIKICVGRCAECWKCGDVVSWGELWGIVGRRAEVGVAQHNDWASHFLLPSLP